MRGLLRTALALPMLALAVMPGLADGDEYDHDEGHDRALRALQERRILPLGTILDRVGATIPGEVLEVELEREGRLWLYELTVLASGGRLLEVAVDAATGAIVEIEGNDSDDRRSRRPRSHR